MEEKVEELDELLDDETDTGPGYGWISPERSKRIENHAKKSTINKNSKHTKVNCELLLAALLK